MSALSERLHAAKKDRSIDTIAERARAQGHPINRATIARALQGRHAQSPTEDVLTGLAAGFGVDVRELRRLVGMPPGELGPWTPPAESSRLSREQRAALTQLIKTIVDQEVVSDGQRSAQKSSRRTPTAGPDTRKV